jgi:hypothetical protein
VHIGRKHETDSPRGRSNTSLEADPAFVDISDRGGHRSSDRDEGERDELTAGKRHRDRNVPGTGGGAAAIALAASMVIQNAMFAWLVWLGATGVRLVRARTADRPDDA